jgi:hypothetical protein
MAAYARVCWTVDPEPWVLEHQAITTVSLTLNLDQNSHPFRLMLSALRSKMRAAALEQPIVR